MARRKSNPSKPDGSFGSRSRTAEGGNDDVRKPLDERPILKHFQTFLKDNEVKCREAWNTAEENQRFAAGGAGQWDKKAWDERTAQGRLAFTLDDCSLATRAISGREMTARFEPTFLARSSDDAQRVSVYREVVRYLRERASADNVESMAFRDLTIDDYSVVEWGQRYDGDDPHGRTVCEHNPIWEHVWDTRARATCLTDRDRDARGYYVSVDEFLMLFPREKERLQKHLGAKASWVSESVRSQYRHPWSAFAEKGQFVKREEAQVFLVSYHWRQREAAWMATVPAGLAMPEEHALHPVSPEEWAAIGQALQMELPVVDGTEMWAGVKPILQQAADMGLIDPALVHRARPRLIKMTEPEWAAFQEAYGQQFGRMPDALTPEDGVFRWGLHEAMIIGDSVVRERRLPYRHFPRIYMTGVPFSQLSGTKFQSVVDSMKDPQRFKNLVITMAASHLQKMQKMGAMYHANAFENPNDLENKLSEPFWLAQVRNGVAFDEALRVVDGAGFPAGLDRFLDLADQATWRPTGMNPNTLGNLQDPRRVSGTVFQALADAVMTVLSIEFNSLKTMRKIGAELKLDICREHLDRDDLIDIVGPEKASFIPDKSEWRYSFAFDAITEEVPTTKSEKEAGWKELAATDALNGWVTAGIAPPWIIPVMMPDGMMAEENRKKWLDWLEAKGLGPNSPAVPPPAPGQEQAGGDPAAVNGG